MLNVALVGCGRISQKHVRAIETHPDLEFFACFDIIKERMPVNTGHYASFEDMLKDEHVDIISICTPSDLHAPMALRAIDHGKHVLIEKPIALSVEDGARVVQASMRKGVTLGVIVQNRFNAPLLQVKSMLKGDTFGKVLIANATCRWHRPQEYYSDWQASWQRSGGVIVNQLIHSIDALLWLVDDIVKVSAVSRNMCRRLEFPDTYLAHLFFNNGAIGSLEGSICAYPRNAENSISLVCEKGTVKIGGVALDQISYMLLENHVESRVHRLTKWDVYGDSHVDQYAEFVKAIKQERQPSTSGPDAVVALNVALSIHHSSQIEKEVLIEQGRILDNLTRKIYPRSPYFS